ncbi:MAG TPA: glycosyltransferase family 4 protein [Anaerolineales bacterium]
MNWMHRVYPRVGRQRADLRHFLRAEYGNFLLALIRSRLVQRIVYQSEFSRKWWERVYGPAPVASKVIFNGVDLSIYTEAGAHQRPADCCRVLLVEGSLMGGYEQGLETAVQFAESLDQEIGTSYSFADSLRVELMIAGRVAPQLQAHWTGRSKVPIRWAGLVPRDRIPEVDRSAHLLYSADLNAACPNSVVEALACGLPVVALDTGALSEMVTGDAGRVTPFGGDPWKLDPPDVQPLAVAALEILSDPDRFRKAARLRAEEAFSLDRMVEEYLACLT